MYNLCEEKTYDPQSFGGEVVLFPFGDHQVRHTLELSAFGVILQTPALRMIIEFCENAEQWLLADPRNTVVVHCKAGKGRTGIMICALLMYMVCVSAHCLASTCPPGSLRGTGRGVTLVCQKAHHRWMRRHHSQSKKANPTQALSLNLCSRYIFYFYKLLRSGKTVPSPVLLQLHQIRLTGLPKHVLPRLMVCLWLRESNASQGILLAEVRSVAATKHNGACFTSHRMDVAIFDLYSNVCPMHLSVRSVVRWSPAEWRAVPSADQQSRALYHF